MCALVAVLLKMDGIPLNDWRHIIQPNSLIAILTTVAKTSLMVPAASCISQLKWHHYQKPRRLIELQVFDDASRGPWGSIVLIARLFRSRALVAMGLAIITVMALGIGPCAQQILDFSNQSTSLTNSTIMLGRADAYFAKGYRQYSGKDIQAPMLRQRPCMHDSMAEG